MTLRQPAIWQGGSANGDKRDFIENRPS